MIKLAILLGVNLIILIIWLARRGGRVQKWALAAKQLGLHAEGLKMTGTVDDVLTITVQPVTRTVNRVAITFTVVHIESNGAIPPDISLGPEGFFSANRDLQIGDPPFDQVVKMSGPDATLTAVLDVQTRQRLSRLVTQGLNVTGGAVHYERKGMVDETPALVALVGEVIQIANGLRLDQAPVPNWLGMNALQDPVPMVRYQNLWHLLASFSHTPVAADVSRRSLGDANPEVALLAGGYLQDKDTLRRVLNNPAQPQTRGGALEKLAALLEPHERADLLSKALQHEQGPVLVAAIRAAAAHGHREAEPVLLHYLGTEDPALRLAVVQALGLIGGRDAVEPLLPLRKKGLLGGNELSHAAAHAVEQIQGRLAGGAGGLSLSEIPEGAGGLSVAGGGELSGQ